MNNQPDLFSYLTSEPIRFDGETYEPEKDEERLTGLLKRVFDYMKDGQWRTLNEIKLVTRGTEASVSARLRDLRKERFGQHEVNRRSVGERRKGLFEYQLKVRTQ